MSRCVKVKEAFVSQIPLAEFGLPVDIAEVAAFLASSRCLNFSLYLPKVKNKKRNLASLGPNTSQQQASMSTGASLETKTSSKDKNASLSDFVPFT